MSSLKPSLILGGIVSISLLLFGFLLFYTLFISADDSVFVGFDDRIWQLLLFSLFQAFLSTLLSIVVGLLLSWSLAHHRAFWGRSFLVAVFSSSLVLPTLVVVFGLISIYGRNGWINSLFEYLFDYSFGTYLYGLFGILLAHVYLNASFASRSLLHAFESIDIQKYKLAKSLGFGVFKRFIHVELPAIVGTLFTLASTIFLLCFTSFAIVLILGGTPSYNTLEVAIYEAVRFEFDIGMALRLAFVQLLVSALFLALFSNLHIVVSNLKSSSSKIPWQEGRYVRYFQISVIVIFSLFFISPLVAVVVDGFGADFKKILMDDLFKKSFVTTIKVASFSSVLTLIVALLLSDTKRNFTLMHRYGDRKYSKILNLLVSFSGNLYLAVSSLILGLGFFLLSREYPFGEDFWAIFALITANVLMSLPFSLSVLAPLMQKSANRYDRLVASLGIGYIKRWIYIEFPYLAPSIGYVLALSFCFSLGDLGIIALFGSDEFSTLPWYLYQLMGSYRSIDAAGVSLILLSLVLVVFVTLPILFGRFDVKDR